LGLVKVDLSRRPAAGQRDEDERRGEDGRCFFGGSGHMSLTSTPTCLITRHCSALNFGCGACPPDTSATATIRAILATDSAR
jgi:hypothetical protein